MDRHAHILNRRSEFELRPFYGQLLSILVFSIPGPDEVLGTTGTQSFVLAAVLPYDIMDETAATRGLILSDGHTRAIEIIDAQTIDQAVGRIKSGNEVAFLEKIGSRHVLEVLDDPETAAGPDLSTLD